MGGAAPAAPPAFSTGNDGERDVRARLWARAFLGFGPGATPVLPDVTTAELVAWFVEHGHYASKSELVERFVRDYVVLRRAAP